MTRAGQELFDWAEKHAEFYPKVLRKVSEVFVALADESRSPIDKIHYDEAAQRLWDAATAAEELRAKVPL